MKNPAQNSVALSDNRTKLAKFIEAPAGVSLAPITDYLLLGQKGLNEFLGEHASSTQSTPCSINDLIGQAWDQKFTAAGSAAILALGKHLKNQVADMQEVRFANGGGSPEVAMKRINAKAAMFHATDLGRLKARIDSLSPFGSGSVQHDLEVQTDIAERGAAAQIAAEIIQEQITKDPLHSLSQVASKHEIVGKIKGVLTDNQGVIETAKQTVLGEAKTILSRKVTR